jgi:protein-tyrosine phosphatase
VLSQRSDEGVPFRVLFVCTGNVCRSPLAERLSVAYLDAVLGPAAAAISVESAGTNAVVGRGMHPYSADALASLGGNAAGFVARQLTEEIASRADLVLALTREHRHAVLKRSPRGLARTFTVLEAADLAAMVPSVDDLPGANVGDQWRSLTRRMAAARALRTSSDADDIADPIGAPPEVHQQIGDRIAEGVLRLFGRFVDPGSAPEPLDLRPAEPYASGR